MHWLGKNDGTAKWDATVVEDMYAKELTKPDMSNSKLTLLEFR